MNKKVKNASDKKELLLLLEEDWQKIVNIIAEILDIKVVLINKVDESEIEIIKTNETKIIVSFLDMISPLLN